MGLALAFCYSWLIVIAGVALLITIGGLLFEYYVGQNAHAELTLSAPPRAPPHAGGALVPLRADGGPAVVPAPGRRPPASGGPRRAGAGRPGAAASPRSRTAAARPAARRSAPQRQRGPDARCRRRASAGGAAGLGALWRPRGRLAGTPQREERRRTRAVRGGRGSAPAPARRDARRPRAAGHAAGPRWRSTGALLCVLCGAVSRAAPAAGHRRTGDRPRPGDRTASARGRSRRRRARGPRRAARAPPAPAPRSA